MIPSIEMATLTVSNKKRNNASTKILQYFLFFLREKQLDSQKLLESQKKTTLLLN